MLTLVAMHCIHIHLHKRGNRIPPSLSLSLFPRLPFLLFKLPSFLLLWLLALAPPIHTRLEEGGGERAGTVGGGGGEGEGEQEMRRAAFFVLDKMFKTSMTALRWS